MLIEFDFKAFLIGAVFCSVSVLVVWGAFSVVQNASSGVLVNTVQYPMLLVIGMCMLILSGFVSGFIAGQQGMKHGVYVAVIGVFFAVIVKSLLNFNFADVIAIKGYLMTGLVLCIFAGGIGEIVALARGRNGL